jgi:3-hydroxybutyrate dehydrogenase
MHNPLFDLSGRTALITGSSRGLGRAMAEGLARAGASIIVNGTRSDSVHVAVAEMRATGFTAEGLAFDVTDEAAILRAFADLDARGVAVDILVNNAGIQFVSKVEDFPLDKWDEVISVNLSSIFHLIKLVIPGMKARKRGRVINIASVHGLIGSTKKAAYTAAKHGLVGLTKVVGLEYCTHGITCNAICPGWVRTPLVERQIEAIAKEKGISIDEAVIDLLSEKQPSLQFATPAQLGGLAVFLAGDDAAQINGTSIAMDGGWTAR